MPAVRAVDMEEYVQRLRVAVGRLEDAFAARSLADVLADPALADCIGRDLADVYERLARHHAVPSGFRARNVAALLESTVRILASPACWYPASDVSAGMSPLVEPGAGDAGELRERRRVELIATEGPEGRVSLRFDQMLSVRFWGIGFTFADEEVADVVLAVAIRQRFRDAIAARLDHPLGPMAAVPESLRRLVCAYVTAETFRSTEQLREREARAAFADRPPDEGG